jgi:hypothetical protein
VTHCEVRPPLALVAALATATAMISVASCAQEPVRVSNTASADYGREQLQQAVATFVAAGRSPVAYAALARRISELLPTMDKTVAEEAELKLTVLALAPTQAVKDLPLAAQVEALATTVWPTAFAERLQAPSLVRGIARSESELAALANESHGDYLRRLCSGALSQVCRDSVPEWQSARVAAHAVHRFSERARRAVSDCLVCASDPSWRTAVRGWEELDTVNNTWIRDVEKRSDPSNWPVAGAGGDADAALAEVELSKLGELLIAQQPVPAPQRPKALRTLLGDGKAFALHIRPETSLARLREIAAELQRAGAASIAVVARAPQYPWERRLYRVALGKGRRVDARGNDTLQVLLRLVDALGPGITRLD